MDDHREILEKFGLGNIADKSGLAAAVIDASSREVAVANNNSICRNLNPAGKFSPACAQFCGQALAASTEAGKIIGFECHAGLECRAIPVLNAEEPYVVIVGRTFLKSANYRKATERAASGDWSHYAPSDFFENILLTGSAAILDRSAERIETMLTAAAEVENKMEAESPADAERSAKPGNQITNLVEKFNRKVGLKGNTKNPDPEPGLEPDQHREPEIKYKRPERRTREARSWRAFFSSLLKNDFANATDSILEFLANHYGFSTLLWLERTENRLVSTTGFGDIKRRRLSLGVAIDDPRLVEAFQTDTPLELNERSKGQSTKRTMKLFPIGVGGEITAAIAILDPIDDPVIRTQIARIGRSIAPQLEILRLRNKVFRGDTIANAVRRFGESLKRVDTDDLWLTLTQKAAELLRAERASLLIYNEKSETLEIKALIGVRNNPTEDEDVGARVSKEVFSKNEPLAVADVSETGLLPASVDRKYKTSSFLSYPVNIGGRSIGVMNFADRACGTPFDASSLELLEAIAPQLAVAIDRASLKEKAGEFEHLSVTDELTGLLNRRYIEARLKEEVKRSNRHGFPMSFLMLDVDHFKSYNDQFGHPAGDEALKLVGAVIRETLRGADVAARFGGEEFCILLPQTTAEEAAAIADRVRSNIVQTEFPHRRVSVSIGIASCSAELCASSDLILAADKALYEAKRQGRNRVLAFEEMSKTSNETQN